jgi:hypothetical protein
MGRNSVVLYKGNRAKKLHRIQLKKPNIKAGLYVIRLAIDGKKVDAKRVIFN